MCDTHIKNCLHISRSAFLKTVIIVVYAFGGDGLDGETFAVHREAFSPVYFVSRFRLSTHCIVCIKFTSVEFAYRFPHIYQADE